MRKIKKNKTLSLLLIACFCSLVLNAQEQQRSNRLYSGEIQNISYLVYPPVTHIKAASKSQKEITFQYPESLMLSIMSCSDATWESYHTLGGKANADIKEASHYAYIKTMNRDKNYFELKHKFEFEVMGVPTAIIKFYLITEQSPQPQVGVVTMQKIDGRWQKTSMQMFSKMAMIALRLKSDVLEKIINQDQSDKFLRAIHERVFDKQTLNFDKLSAEIDSWYMEETKYNKEMKSYFKDPNSLF